MIKVLAGLGNPGNAYKKHRHNVGYWLIDRIVKVHKLKEKEKPGFLYYEWDHDFGQTILLKSKRYMNESGFAIQSVKQFYKYNLEDIWVAYDDMDFEPGVVRVRLGGGAGGHNGIKSVVSQIGSGFYRLRYGVGRPLDASEVKNYVLSSPINKDRDLIEESIDKTLSNIDLLLQGRYDVFTEKLHRE